MAKIKGSIELINWVEDLDIHRVTEAFSYEEMLKGVLTEWIIDELNRIFIESREVDKYTTHASNVLLLINALASALEESNVLFGKRFVEDALDIWLNEYDDDYALEDVNSVIMDTFDTYLEEHEIENAQKLMLSLYKLIKTRD